MMVASKYQHTAHVNSKLVFRGNAMVGLLIFWITLDVAIAGAVKIRDGANGRIGFSFQLPLADCLPCVIYVNYIDRKNFVKRQFGRSILEQVFKIWLMTKIVDVTYKSGDTYLIECYGLP
jgi:hypothetical protein